MNILLIIPVYNERDNIPQLIPAIFQAAPQAHLLFIDDNSPDGTGALIQTYAAADARVHLLSRPGKMGLGSAYKTGFQMALQQNYEYIFEMDADFSHDPKYLPDFLNAIEHADLVIGSRYIPGGSTPNWTALRRFISGGGNIFARFMLGLPSHDCTSGYRCYRRQTLEAVDFANIQSQGYSFQVELVFQTFRKHLRVAEIPIVFMDRRIGQSKMSRGIFIEAFKFVTGAFFKYGRAPKPRKYLRFSSQGKLVSKPLI